MSHKNKTSLARPLGARDTKSKATFELDDDEQEKFETHHT